MPARLLSDRLRTVLDLLPDCHTLADIGCDHGYLSIEAVRTGKAEQAIASDVRPGPLSAAQAHIRAENLSDRIRVRLTDGLQGFVPGEADSCVICGMGGMMIRTILEEAPEGVLDGLSSLIVQPQTETDEVRRALHGLGFRICEERFVEDRGKYYTILRAEHGAEQYQDPFEYMYGILMFRDRDPVYRSWTEQRVRRLAAWSEAARDPQQKQKLEQEMRWLTARLSDKD